MKPTEDLFQLVHSLSKAEKRYFSLNLSGKNIYQKIFEIIEKQERYDEKEIVEKLKIRQIHVYKNYLYKLILKSLRSFHAESSESILLYNQLQNFEILFDKGLYKQAKKILMRCRAMATATQNRDILGEIYQLEQKLVFMIPRIKDEKLNVVFLDQQEILIEKLAILEGQHLAYQISRHFYRTGILLNDEIRNDIVTINTSIDKINLDSNGFLIYKFWIKYLYSWMTDNFSDAIIAAEKFTHIIDHSENIFDLSILSCEVAYCHARCTIKVKEINEYYIKNGRYPSDFLICLPEGHLASNVIKIMNSYLFFEVGKYLEGVDYLNDILSTNPNNMNEGAIPLLHAATRFHFCMADYKQALKYCNKVINEYTPGVADDFYLVNLLIRIIIHFELKNFEIAEDLIRKVRVILKKYDFFKPLDELLLNKLQDAMLSENKKKYLQHMQELEKAVENLGPKFENTIKLKIYFNFHEWIKAKASDKALTEIIHMARQK